MSKNLNTVVYIPRKKATDPVNVNHIKHFCHCCQILDPFMHNLLLLVLWYKCLRLKENKNALS